ncbi:MAG TPA: hypothetical protein DCM28_17825 [Phycisphaerales bacterium]|nr:hypothetical protein [Phycisphaerales bacterium]HCD31705.1 hypothetical protein [Phycisphaerales bacterium]|tara:strand:- start:580 stop:1068 length:489 start_codon:yes stop_codon:yes gene_type:complete
MTTKRKVQSPLKVAIMHAATASFAYPMIVSIFGQIAVMFIASSVLGERDGQHLSDLFWFVAFNGYIVLGWILGSYRSFAYIRKTCILTRPRDYPKPCIIAGIVVALISFGIECWWIVTSEVSQKATLVFVAIIAHAVAWCLYAAITHHKFTECRPEKMPKDA